MLALPNYSDNQISNESNRRKKQRTNASFETLKKMKEERKNRPLYVNQYMGDQKLNQQLKENLDKMKIADNRRMEEELRQSKINNQPYQKIQKILNFLNPFKGRKPKKFLDEEDDE